MARLFGGLIWTAKRLLFGALILTIDTLGPTKGLVKTLNNLSIYYSDHGALASAEACLDAAIWLAPNYATPYANRARLAYGRGDRAKALEDYRRAQVLWPKDIRFTASREWAEARLGNDPEMLLEAQARHQDLEDRRPLYHVWPALALAWMKQAFGGRHSRAPTSLQ
jgi:tetratricopeptide (TPR) repeat protein